jgi:uncharacterized protein (TIGR02246 family)
MRIRIPRTLALMTMALVLITASVNDGLAQETGTSPPDASAARQLAPSSPQLDAIRAESKAFVDAFNQADAAAVAACWTVDGEYVDDSGNTFTGRDAIAQAYSDFFRDNPKAKLQINIESLRLLSPTTAIEEGVSMVEVPPGSATVGRYMAIHVLADGKWQMASVRDVLLAMDVAGQNAADLDWLIGTWVAEEHGSKHESVCSWVSGHAFVKRDFTTTLFDGTQSSGVQMIGWNPQAGYVQSWTFSPDGGHSVGAWTPTENGWAAQTQGMTGDGITTTSTNLMRRLDDNAYVWMSVDRTVGGVAIPDTDEVVLKRQPAAAPASK